MIQIDVQSLKPGLILAADVKNSHGQLLIKKGVEISERHIRVLKSWGVVDVQAEGIGQETESDPHPDFCDPALLNKARTEVLEKFSHNNLEHPAVDELLRICVRRHARELSHP
jgi:hypothetical protein